MITEGGKLSPVDRIVSPGVFTRENDLSGIAQGVADIGGAIVAPFPKGPAFAPTLVNSVSELEEKFGVTDGVYYGPYTAREYISEKGFGMVCRVGSLTGYKQNFPYVIYARKGDYTRNEISASVIGTSSLATIVDFPNAGSVSVPVDTASLYTSTDATVTLNASVTFGADPSNPYQNQTVSLGTFDLTNVSLEFGSGSEYVGAEFNAAYELALAAGTLVIETTVSSSVENQVGAQSGFENFTPINWIINQQKLGVCANYSILINGEISGAFGTFTGEFVPSGSYGVDPCTNEWGSSSADFRVLAVLANTQYTEMNGLECLGFSGSNFYQGPRAFAKSSSAFVDETSSSISNNYAVELKGTGISTPYGVYEFSVDPSNPKFITNVFTDDATSGKPPVPAGSKIEAAYLYKVFENQLTMVAADNTHYKVYGQVVPNNTFLGEPLDFTDIYSTNLEEGDSEYSIKNASTPWIISQAMASWDGSSDPSRYRLFKVHTLSDGTAANTSYKIEISNVRLAGQIAGSDWGSFTLTIRRFDDTDKRPVILESFQNLNFDETSKNYILKRIGDRYSYINSASKLVEFGNYSNLSKYIRIEMCQSPFPITSVPAGFEKLNVPVNGSVGEWLVPVRYSRASLYGIEPGKYPSGVAFVEPPYGADTELSALYPLSSVGNGSSKDNNQYFAPLPNYGGKSNVGRNTVFALDQPVSEWGFDAPASTGSFLSAELNGAIPFIYDSQNEQTYVKMRKFVVGFQNGFDGESPSKPINVGADITSTNTQGLNCANITTAGSIAYKQCINALGNSDEFDINLIVTPGIVHEYHPYVVNLVVDMCEKRGDCFYITDLNVMAENVGEINDVVEYAREFDTNYAAAYYPWVKIPDPYTGKIISVPPSVVLPAVYASNDKVSAEWFAPAGLNRGGISQAVQVLDRTTHEERDTLYEGKVNPIAAFPGQGICVWGQKTLQNAASALDRVNVRRLLINIKKYFASTSKYLVFEQNVASTRNKFLAIVNPYLESIQQRSGLYAFQVVMDDTNNTPELIDRNILYGQIYLKPTRTAEFIVLDFNVLPTGASFPTA